MKIKICCISSLVEAKMALQFGADALGLVGEMPSGPGVISDQKIATIVAGLSAEINTFLLTSETQAQAITDHHQRTQTKTIQLVDQIEPYQYTQLRAALPDVQLVQVIHVLDERAIEEALALEDQVDALLLDSGNPNLAVKELGGTGRTHNWAVSRALVEAVRIPVFLAGGLRADNVQRAIDEVQPYGLDLCSGVRTSGELDPQKLEAFFTAARG